MDEMERIARGLSEAQRRDLTTNWDRFCDGDRGDIVSDDRNYPDGIEGAGFVFLDDVDEDDLETPFAWELGIERDRLIYRLTPLGLAVRQFLQNQEGLSDEK